MVNTVTRRFTPSAIKILQDKSPSPLSLWERKQIILEVESRAKIGLKFIVTSYYYINMNK